MRWRRLMPVAALAAMLVFAAGCAGQKGPHIAGDVPVSVEETDEAPDDGVVPEASASVLAQGFGAGPSPSAGRSPTAKPGPAKGTKPQRKKAPTETRLPPPPPKPAPDSCEPTYAGKALSRSAVKEALTAAAGRAYWPSSAPSLTVPLNLVKAVAWQESGWQSNVVACDGGVGLMQVMPPTADFINTRFEKSYDIDDPADNATLGANYLAWLIKYFGDVYFSGDYTVSTSGDCASSSAPCLINAVISAYNMGFGAVDTDSGLTLANPGYIANVRALMTGCECLSF